MPVFLQIIFIRILTHANVLFLNKNMHSFFLGHWKTWIHSKIGTTTKAYMSSLYLVFFSTELFAPFSQGSAQSWPGQINMSQPSPFRFPFPSQEQTWVSKVAQEICDVSCRCHEPSFLWILSEANHTQQVLSCDIISDANCLANQWIPLHR